MNIKHIIAGLLAVASMPVLAAPPAIGTTPNNVIFVAGSSALQTFIQSRIQSNANAGDCLVLNEDTSPLSAAPTLSASNYVAYLCTANANAGVTVGNTVLYYYTKKGGSYNGTVPVGQQLPVAHLNLASCRLSSGVTYGCQVQATATDAPCIGASDLESTAFVGNNIGGSQTGYSASLNKAGYASTCPFFQTFGIAVNNNFYSALQIAQGLKVAAGGVNQTPAVGTSATGYVVGDACNAARTVTYTNTAGSITVGTPSTTSEVDYVDNSCRPNLNEAWISAVNSDAVFDPSALHIPAGTGTIGSGTFDANQYIYWIHRGAGSGTQAGFNATFMNTPFAPSVGQVTSPYKAGLTQRGNIAGYACGSTGDVKSFLSTGAAPASCTSGTANETTLAPLPAPATAFAMGIVGLDNQPVKTIGGSAKDENWQFVKLHRADGENPYDAVNNAAFNTAADIKDGLYPYMFSSCFNTTTTNTAAVCDPNLRSNLYGDFDSATTQALICNTAPNVPGASVSLSSNGIFCTPESAACTAASPAARCLNITRDLASGEPLRTYK